MGMPRDSSSNDHPPHGGSGSSGDAVNSPQCRWRNNLSSPWARVVQGQAESTSPVQHSPSPPRSPSINSAAPEQSFFSEKVMSSSSSSPPPPVDNAEGANVNNNVSLPKKPAWNKPSNGVLENEPVMGAESWPALSESARAPPKSSSVEALWKSPCDGSVTSSEGPVIPHSPQKQTASSAKSNSAPNHTMPARQRSMKRGSGGGGGSSMSGGGPPQSTFAHPPAPPPPPPHPFPLPSHMIPAAPDQSSMEHSYRGSNWEMRPVGSFVPQPHVVNDHRNYSRRGNFGPRGDGPLHNNYGGRRQDRGNMNAGDVHVQSQRGQARPLVRPPTSAPPFVLPQNMRPFPNHVGIPDVLYFPTMPMEPFRGMGPYVSHGPYPAMYMPVPDPPLPFKIVTQIDYYFSDVNLEGDDFLKSNMDDQGWVPIGLIASFPRVKNLTNNIQFILDSLRGSAIVEVQDDKLRRRNNWMKYLPNSSRLGTSSTSPPATGPNQEIVATSLEKLNLSQEASDSNNEPGETTPHSGDAAGRLSPRLTGQSMLSGGNVTEDVNSGQN
ncbi:putative Winged-helix DNA-binding transcription factor family protein [Tripterygium wilfordii]|uniref:Putative Winged-helix DNA-binding transcription factor family protein n=1 Tax=Tripterygium wilfordii TaxID=458696 RepID=A0A7J7DLM1_TRIWF|nr:la-related protein 1C-like [Tripterygium wilfordii]KAF5747193.1 putative Winged-helix DNA-binding transcription factor family protein [Tripterygium wilfordii]